jgi:integrase
VGPVAEEFVTAAEQYLSSTIRAMIRLQQLSGARPGEICALRGQDLEISTDRVWIARPTLHKLTHKGIVREIFFGPQAIAILKPLLKPDLTEPIFSPAAAERQRRQMQRLKRTTPLWPSHAQRYQHQHRRRPKRSPGMQYTPASYRTAIARACERAFPPPAPLDRQKGESSRAWRLRLTLEQRKQLRSWRCRHRFQPNQLRHSFATQVRRDYGLDVSQILLGHSSVTTTETYAMPDQDRAREVIAKIG